MSQTPRERVIPFTMSVSRSLGTRRSTITVAAGILRRAGLITYYRGEVKIKDRVARKGCMRVLRSIDAANQEVMPSKVPCTVEVQT